MTEEITAGRVYVAWGINGYVPARRYPDGRVEANVPTASKGDWHAVSETADTFLPNTVTIEWVTRSGETRRESGPRGYINSRIAGLQHANRPVRIVTEEEM